MAIWNPHLISTKLCRVLDAGYATIDELARAAGVSPEFLERAANNAGLKLDVETKHRIGKALSPYFHAHPELYREPTRIPKRGVFAITPCPRGRKGYGVYSSTGEWLGDYYWPTKLATEARVQWLWRQLDLEDTQLRIVD